MYLKEEGRMKILPSFFYFKPKAIFKIKFDFAGILLENDILKLSTPVLSTSPL